MKTESSTDQNIPQLGLPMIQSFKGVMMYFQWLMNVQIKKTVDFSVKK